MANTTLPAHGEEGYDRLGNVIEAVRQSFLFYYSPHHECNIDEAMVKFKGSRSLKRYLPKKPTKRDFKIWVRADSTNGYVSDLDVYTCKEDTTTTSLGAKVVDKLSTLLMGGALPPFFRQFFTSLPLVDSLLANGLYACGTFCKDRQGMPMEISTIELGW